MALSVTRLFNSLSVGTITGVSRSVSTSAGPLCFHLTAVLGAMPMKRKKRVDPAVVKMRADRKRKHLMKDIRILKKNEGQLKPIHECVIPLNLHIEKVLRERKNDLLSEEQFESEIQLQKSWGKYKTIQKKGDMVQIHNAMKAKQKALDELKSESEELYREAIQLEVNVFPYTINGPTRTPQIPGYFSPDGSYKDITEKWEWNAQSIDDYLKNRKSGAEDMRKFSLKNKIAKKLAREDSFLN